MNQYKALMAGFATVIGLGGVAAYNGVFSSPPAVVQHGTSTNEQPAALVTATDPAKAESATAETAMVDPAKAADPVAAPEATSQTAAPIEPAKGVDPAVSPAAIAPTFDVLRVESNGSVLIAGKAEKDAQVEVLSGANVLGATKAQANGDFAIVIENPLKPGDYQLVLRQTLPDGSAATSVETATVSVPEKLDGPVLALVEEPGKPSRIITTPETAEVAMQAQVTSPAIPAESAVAADPAKPADAVAPAQTVETTTPAVEAASTTTTDGTVNIEAVETEGNKIFVAGSAKGVASVRVYANDVILGESKSLPGDRFLLEIQKELAAGDYIIKAEGLASDGVTVLGRSLVPFKRASDDTIAAVATPAQDATPSADTPADKKMAVIIRRGDTLWQISRRIYGRGVRYSTIYLANKDAINNPDRIFPGQIVAIPGTTVEGEAANAEEIKKRENPE